MAGRLPNDTTFRSYSSAQVLEYARRRGGYPQKIIEEIVALHASTESAFESLLDIGCGPGTATRQLAAHFDHATGIDPSPAMVQSAIELGGDARKAPIRFIQDETEVCKNIPDQSIDLITAATSAHWFDFEQFWPTAARILKPNETVAIFNMWRIYCHPSMPHANEIQRILFELEQGPDALGPYQKPGNWSVMNEYKDLRMPWSIFPPCSSFSETSYRRQVWNEKGLPSKDGSYVYGERTTTLEEAEQAIATISAVTRWRDAHAELANTPEDCVRAASAQIRRILGPEEADRFTMVGATVLITVKKAQMAAVQLVAVVLPLEGPVVRVVRRQSGQGTAGCCRSD